VTADGHAVSHHSKIGAVRGQTLKISYPHVEASADWITEVVIPGKLLG
jgi:hypothetical protein